MDAITNLFLKIGGLLIFVFNISNINYYIAIYVQYKDKSFLSFVAIVIAPNIFQLALSLFMFFSPGKISSKFIDKNDDYGDIINDNNIIKIEQICISILGLYMICHCLSDLIFNVSSYIKAVSGNRYIDSANIDNSNFIITIFVTLIEMFIAFLLVTQNKKIANMIAKLRSESNDKRIDCEK